MPQNFSCLQILRLPQDNAPNFAQRLLPQQLPEFRKELPDSGNLCPEIQTNPNKAWRLLQLKRLQLSIDHVLPWQWKLPIQKRSMSHPVYLQLRPGRIPLLHLNFRQCVRFAGMADPGGREKAQKVWRMLSVLQPNIQQFLRYHMVGTHSNSESHVSWKGVPPVGGLVRLHPNQWNHVSSRKSHAVSSRQTNVLMVDNNQ